MQEEKLDEKAKNISDLSEQGLVKKQRSSSGNYDLQKKDRDSKEPEEEE